LQLGQIVEYRNGAFYKCPTVGPTTLRVMEGWTMLIHDLFLSNLATVFISFQVGIVCFHNIGFVAPFGYSWVDSKNSSTGNSRSVLNLISKATTVGA